MAKSESLVWRKYDEMESRLSRPLSDRMVQLAGLGPGQRVVDVASGRGEPAVPAAHRVFPGGHVIGVDKSEEVLSLARDRARREGLGNVEFRAMDAESMAGIEDGWADAVLSRWGLMYFEAPVVALRSVRRILVSGGLLVVAVWADADRVSYVSVPRGVLSKHADVGGMDPRHPGPCRYGSLSCLEGDLRLAGFTVEHVEEIEVAVMEAETQDELVEWVLAFGQSSAVQAMSEEVQREWRRDLLSAAEPYRTGGVVRLGGLTRVVVARAVG